MNIKMTPSKIERARKLRSLGIPDAEIAKRLGVAAKTVTRRLGPRDVPPGDGHLKQSNIPVSEQSNVRVSEQSNVRVSDGLTCENESASTDISDQEDTDIWPEPEVVPDRVVRVTSPAHLAALAMPRTTTVLWNGWELEVPVGPDGQMDDKAYRQVRDRAMAAYGKTMGNSDPKLWRAFVMTLAPSEHYLMDLMEKADPWT